MLFQRGDFAGLLKRYRAVECRAQLGLVDRGPIENKTQSALWK